jgi:hypothetical protein
MSEFTLAAPPFVLTPEVIIALAQRNLQEMDGQIGNIVRIIEDKRGEADRRGREMNALRDFIEDLRASGHVTDSDGTIRMNEMDDGDAAGFRAAIGLTTREELLRHVGDNATLRAKIEALPDGPVANFDDTFDDQEVEALFRQAVEDRYGIEIPAGSNSFNIDVFETELDTLTEEQRLLNSENEMLMVQLQSRMQQRTQIIQLGSNMLKSIDEGLDAIIGNMR